MKGVLLLAAFALACGHKAASGPPTTTGGGEPEGGDSSTGCEPGRCLPDISKRIQERRIEARACYDKVYKKKPAPEPRLIINFKIDADGNVEDASQGMQEHQIEDATVVDCVVAVITKLKFPKSPAGKTTRAYHTFEFSAP